MVRIAINIYFDGSWKSKTPTVLPPKSPTARQSELPRRPSSASHVEHRNHDSISANSRPPKATTPSHKSMPTKRYIGAFGVTGWATRSGPGLLKHAEKVGIERTALQPVSKLGRGGKARIIPSRRQDVVVRFSNSRGE